MHTTSPASPQHNVPRRRTLLAPAATAGRLGIVIALLTLAGVTELAAQQRYRVNQADTAALPRATATREELEAALAAARAEDPDDQVIATIEQRLQEGDFYAGDRIVLAVEGESTLADTFTVRPGRVLDLPYMPPIPLDGVLRSELDAYLTQQIGEYIRDPVVDAIPLIRVAVMGAVNSPGFYTVPAEMLITEVIMQAGGPGGNADLDETIVTRRTATIREEEEVRAAIARGASLDQMNLLSGDEIVVGDDGGGIAGVLTVLGALSGVAWAVSRVF